MLAGSHVEINKEILVATLEAFSKRGFCGDLFFVINHRRILLEVEEVHHFPAELAAPADWANVVNEISGPISLWLTLPETLFLVRFNNGRITKVQTRDRTRKSEND
jgi:hypothetical protein